MPRVPKPWYRKDRDAWFVTIHGIRHNLGRTKKEAMEQFYKLMNASKPSQAKCSIRLFPAIADLFLEHVQKNRSAATYEWYRYRLERFCQRYPNLEPSALQQYHVQEWVDSYPIAKTTKRNYIRSVKGCVAWAKEQGYIDDNPLGGLKAPSAENREVYLSQAEFDSMLKEMPSEVVRTISMVAYQNGCRPQEILRVEAILTQRIIDGFSQSMSPKGKRHREPCTCLPRPYPISKRNPPKEGLGQWHSARVDAYQSFRIAHRRVF